jgi:hypothetical protein
MKTRLLLLVATLFGIFYIAAPLTVGAFDPFGGVDCSGEQGNTAVCSDQHSGNPIAGPDGVLIKITNIVAYIAGAIAVIMILVGSIRFITSGSDISTGSRTDTDVEAARDTIVNALIGLAVIILAKVIITYVITKL